MTVRVAVRNRLQLSDSLRGMFDDRMYPLADADGSVLDPLHYPAAFDAMGDVRPTLLVRDGGSFPFGPHGAQTGQVIVDVLLWQAGGRDIIDAAIPLIRKVLEAARIDTQALYVYDFRFAGESQSGRDQALRDAEHGWSRWQSAYRTKG